MKTVDPIPNTPIPASAIDWPYTTDDGVGASSIGEDGEDWIAQGHMDPKAAFDLFWKCAANLLDEISADEMFGPDGSYNVADVKAGYGVFNEHMGHCELVTGEIEDEEDGPYCPCQEFGWCVTWGKVTADTPGAVPIMVLEA